MTNSGKNGAQKPMIPSVGDLKWVSSGEGNDNSKAHNERNVA